jgi:hypothetical protein
LGYGSHIRAMPTPHSLKKHNQHKMINNVNFLITTLDQVRSYRMRIIANLHFGSH